MLGRPESGLSPCSSRNSSRYGPLLSLIPPPRPRSRLTFEGGKCHNFVPVLGGNSTKMTSPGDFFDQPLGEMKLADHVGDHVVLSSEGVVLVNSSGTESSYPRPPQSLKHSAILLSRPPKPLLAHPPKSTTFYMLLSRRKSTKWV